jgi:hypothetical protein
MNEQVVEQSPTGVDGKRKEERKSKIWARGAEQSVGVEASIHKKKKRRP